jgi:hypothetical protein
MYSNDVAPDGAGKFMRLFSTNIPPLTGRAENRLFCQPNALGYDGHVESLALPFLFAGTGDAALARSTRSLRTDTGHLPRYNFFGVPYFRPMFCS